jgi:hypothetical protein
MTMTIFVKASSAAPMGGGIMALEIESASLSREDHETIRRLAPNLADQIFNVLDKEVLLQSIVENPDKLPPDNKPVLQEPRKRT